MQANDELAPEINSESFNPRTFHASNQTAVSLLIAQLRNKAEFNNYLDNIQALLDKLVTELSQSIDNELSKHENNNPRKEDLMEIVQDFKSRFSYSQQIRIVNEIKDPANGFINRTLSDKIEALKANKFKATVQINYIPYVGEFSIYDLIQEYGESIMLKHFVNLGLMVGIVTVGIVIGSLFLNNSDLIKIFILPGAIAFLIVNLACLIKFNQQYPSQD